MVTIDSDVTSAMPSDATMPIASGRTAFYFQSLSAPLFAWLHRGTLGAHNGHGVVLCPPLGHEQIHSHRAFRHLAEALASAGFPVLRFDYHGTGDSAGNDEDPDRVATWLQNIRDAVAWMRQQLGCKYVTLIGVRLGAALATLACTDGAVDQLVLWAPIVSGRRYVRELRALSSVGSQPTAGPSYEFEAAGFALTSQTIADLNRVDLLDTHPKCAQALVVGRDDLPEDAQLRRHFTALGIQFDQIIRPGYADMMAEPHKTLVPQAAIDSIVTWLCEQTSAEDTVTRPSSLACNCVPTPLLPSQTSLPLPVDEPLASPLALVREHAYHISTDPMLFGIMSEPEVGCHPDLPLIVLLNAGSAYRAGPNRLYVQLSRDLSGRGFRCLRMDLCGLGDSVTCNSPTENDPYSAEAFRDIDLAIKKLVASFDIKRIILVGLCSGAYAAFQSAAQMATSVLVECLLINPLTFFWKQGMSVNASSTKDLRVLHYYITSASRPTKWMRLLVGRSTIGVHGAARVLHRWWQLRRQNIERTPIGSVASNDIHPSHPDREDVARDLDRIVSRGRKLTFFFSDSDPGYWILQMTAKHKVAQAHRSGHIKFFTVKDADHTFSCRKPRLSLIRALSRYLNSAYQSDATPMLSHT
jgi:alpha-beta hydrolase superfamily lysophospholipase